MSDQVAGPKPTQMRVKRLKRHVLGFIKSKDFDGFHIIISRKRLQEGTNHYAEVKMENGVAIEKSIIINPYKNNIDEAIGSLLHEVLHILKPKSKEKVILKWENELMQDISPIERSTVLSRMFREPVWDE